MKTSKLWSKPYRKYLVIIEVCLLLQVLIYSMGNQPQWVERYYSRGFYPVFSYLNKFLFSWVPFSVGDIFYGAVVVGLVVAVYRLFHLCFKKRWTAVGHKSLQIVTYVFALYTFFYVNWGMNYYREPLAVTLGLDVTDISQDDYLAVLEKYIHHANALRSQLDLSLCDKIEAKQDIEAFIKRDTLYDFFLSKTQVKIKEPISSKLISYFTVSGYFNPFTSEVQVNQEIPVASYPFVSVHELAHQMGIGFEDDCNFIAFRKLMHDKNLWYQYSAYYSALESLFRPIYDDKELLEKYRMMLSADVRNDFKEERAFWMSYSNWLDKFFALFYDGYLKHNNQPEGLSRYSMMARLIVAWEKQQ